MRSVAHAARVLSIVALTLPALPWRADGLDAGPNAASTPRRRSVSFGRPSLPAPQAVNDTHEVAQGSVLTVAAPGVLANDTLNGATITGYGASSGTEQASIGAATPTAQGGAVRIDASGGVTFTPAASFSGIDAFRYTIANASGSSTATVTVTVRAPEAPTEFSVTTPGFFFSFSGIVGQNPKLTLVRGRTYTFLVDTEAIHPFEITGAPAGSVSGNNTSQGIVVFRVPLTPGNFRYHCSIHDFGNVIETVAAPPPSPASNSAERNRRNAVAFYQRAFDDAEPLAAVRDFASPSYVLHDAGSEVQAAALERFVRSSVQTRSEIRQVIAEGDRVVIQATVRRAWGQTTASVDVFRFDEEGRIAEQWRVVGD